MNTNLTITNLIAKNLLYGNLFNPAQLSFRPKRSFSKLRLLNFANTFYKTSAHDSSTTFQHISFTNFLNTPIVFENKAFINKVHTNTLEILSFSDDVNIFHCTFQNCKAAEFLGGGGIAIGSPKDININIGHCAFLNCKTSYPKSSGGALIIYEGNAKISVFYTCFYDCSAGGTANIARINSVTSDVDMKYINADYCSDFDTKSLGHGFYITCNTYKASAVNFTRCQAKTTPIFSILSRQSGTFIQEINIHNNTAISQYIFKVEGAEEGKISTNIKRWNILKTKTKKGLSALALFHDSDTIFHTAIIVGNKGKTEFFVESCTLSLFDVKSDNDLVKSKNVQWGEGCNSAIRLQSLQIPGAYDPACYHGKEIKEIFIIDWGSIGTGIGVTAGLIAIGAGAIYAGYLYRKRLGEKIDTEVIGDLTAIVK